MWSSAVILICPVSMKQWVFGTVVKSLKRELAALIHKNTGITVPRSKLVIVIKYNWASIHKRLQDGTRSKLKASFCVRKYLQKEGNDYSEM